MPKKIISVLLCCVLLIHYSVEEQVNVSVTERCVKNVCFRVPEFNTSINANCSCEFYDFGDLLCVENAQGFKKLRHLEESTTDIINSSDTPDVNLLYYMIDNAQCKRTKMEKGHRYFAVIDKCPGGFKSNSTVKHLCEKPTTPLPMVLLSSPLHVIFQNAYCAKCHGALERGFRVSIWPSNINCNQETVVNADDVRKKLEDETCKMEYSMPQSEREINCKFLIIAKQLFQDECSSCYKHLESGQGDRKSLDCVMCQFGIRLTRDMCLESELNTLKSLFSLPKDTEVEIKINGGIFKRSDLCKDNEQFDILYQKCRELVCDLDQIALKGRCLQNRTFFVSPESQLFPNGQKILMINVSLLDMSESNYARNIFIPSLENFTELLSKPKISSFKKGTAIDFDLKLSVKTGRSLDKLFQMFTKLYIDKTFIISLMLNVASVQELTNNSICPLEGYMFTCLVDSHVYFNEDVFYSQYLDKSGNRTLLFQVENIYFDVMIKSIDDEISFNNVCVCIPPNATVSDNSDLNCTHTSYKYTADEIQILADGKLKILGHHLEFEESEFYIQNGTDIVCYNPNKSRSFFKLDVVQAYLSWTCTGLSILCLIITIIFYSIFDELRNLPGKITIALSTCLILGQGLLIIPDLGVGICKYIAAVSHFMWLSAFLWMSCQAVNLLFTFHPKTLQSVDSWKNSQTFNWYLLVCLSIPFIIVSTCFVLDMIPGDHLHVMYGLISCSWMSQNSGIIYAFFVPVGITLVTNVICFSLALQYIEQTMANSEKVTGRRRDRSRCIMYMKLSAVMGFSWIFGFVASFFDVNILWYVYIVLNGLQGLFIFLGFGCNARVRNIISARMSSMTTFSNLFSSP